MRTPSSGSIAVLGFANISRDTAFDYLAEGLSSEVATKLGRIQRLEVKSPSAVRFAMNAAEGDLSKLGRVLNVRHLVEGEVLPGRGRIQVSVRLVTAQTGVVRWSGSYDRPSSDILAILNIVADSIGGAVAGALLPAERLAVAGRAPAVADAYDHYMRGNFLLGQRTAAALQGAMREYDVALRADPRFAPALARLGHTYVVFADRGWTLPGTRADSLRALGRSFADRALAIDSLSSDGWLARGNANFSSTGDPRTSLPSIVRARLVDRRSAEAWHLEGWVLWHAGRDDDAEAALRQALSIDPTRAVSFEILSRVQFGAGRVREAIASNDTAIVFDGGRPSLYAQRARYRLQSGDLAGGRADYAESQRLRDAEPDTTSLLAAYEGDTLAVLRAVATTGRSLASARLLAVLGRELEALRALPDSGSPAYWHSLRTDREFDALRSMPEFRTLIERVRPVWAR